MNDNNASSSLQEPLLQEEEEEEEAISPPAQPLPDDEEQDDDDERRTTHSKSRNISLTLWYMAVRCGGEALWYSSVLSVYVYLLRPDNPAMVGYLSAIEGVAQFFAAAIAGVIADAYRRDHLLKVAAVIGLLASATTFLSSWNQASTPLWWCSLVVVAPVLWGVFDGIGLTASMALFADSMPDGQRSYYFTMRKFYTTCGIVMGPISGLVLFAVLGDEWTIAECSTVICLAQFVLLPAFGMLCFFSDDDVPQDLGGGGEAEQENLLLEEGTNDDQRQDEVEDDDDVPADTAFAFGLSRPRFIAVNAAVSDVTCALASGISFRYFALFLLHNLHLGPVMVLVLDATSCITGAAGLLLVSERVARYLGRSLTSIVFMTIGVTFLIGMILLQQQQQWWCCIVAYVFYKIPF